MAILLVEDNARLCASLTRGFGELDIPVEVANTGRQALDRLLKHNCDAVILDLGLPDIDGLDVLVAAREANVMAPVLVLSARDAVDQRVLALDRGADDFLIKPFVFAELVARLRALLRRSSLPRSASMRFGDLSVDADAPRVRIGERTVSLSPREHALLQHFVQQAGHVATRSEILSTVFGYNFDPKTNVVDVHVAHLRRKLQGSSVQLETVRGRGYRLQLAAADPGERKHD
jgi:two-component system OmpR family response regulator